ncbi:chaplin [Streptomyces gamaensis]|uniref:Chaplin n=1 Tax=Streptomyces gamaensis TaxID=1763542 RepID=A0ABW0Z2V8_9ACTN
MKNIKKAAVLTIAASGLALAGAGIASASGNGGDGAQGKAEGNPGVVSGNVVQVPVDVDTNLCGNTITIVGAMNPAMGNLCVNE